MIHIFDVDYTVIKKTSAWYFLCEALSERIIRFSQIRRLPFEWIRYKLGRPNMDFIEDAVKYFAGIDKSIVDRVAHSCFERRMKQGIYSGAADLIREALGRGERVIFATSSFYSIIQPLEHFFGIESSVASAMEFTDGKTSGKIVGNSCFGGRKKAAVEEWLEKNNIQPHEAVFYSDSYTDIPLLEICGKAVAVNPDWRLKLKAQKSGWEIIYFTKTLK